MSSSPVVDCFRMSQSKAIRNLSRTYQFGDVEFATHDPAFSD
jgi:hypothetical protein